MLLASLHLYKPLKAAWTSIKILSTWFTTLQLRKLIAPIIVLPLPQLQDLTSLAFNLSNSSNGAFILDLDYISSRDCHPFHSRWTTRVALFTHPFRKIVVPCPKTTDILTWRSLPIPLSSPSSPCRSKVDDFHSPTVLVRYRIPSSPWFFVLSIKPKP